MDVETGLAREMQQTQGLKQTVVGNRIVLACWAGSLGSYLPLWLATEAKQKKSI